MFDTRCYNCVLNPDKFDDLDGCYTENNPKYAIYIYEGEGIFKCSRCGNILDLSTSIFTTIVQRKYNEYGELETEILETDPKLKEEGKDSFEQDMYELDIFEDLPVGIYKLDIMWYYYECGGYDCTEWDVKIEILSEEELDTTKFQDKQKHLRAWREYNRNKVHTRLIEDINTNGI